MKETKKDINKFIGNMLLGYKRIKIVANNNEILLFRESKSYKNTHWFFINLITEKIRYERDIINKSNQINHIRVNISLYELQLKRIEKLFI